MTSLATSSKHEPLSSVSEPASPIEEDLAKASAWDDEATSTLVSSKWKGKGKQQDDDDDDEDSPHETEAGQYPPIAEEDLEARKIEENLKRWESLEKQRRKKARDSRKLDSPTGSSSSSFVEDISQRASQLWSKTRSERDAARPRARTSGHSVLEEVDESLPMEEPPATPTPHASTTENPFESAEDRAVQPGPLMTAAGPGSLPPTPRPQPAPDRPILQAQPSQHSVPQPLGLPDPEEEARQRQREQMEEEIARDKRWWTEWLCGCREHGGFQAGRTNPME